METELDRRRRESSRHSGNSRKPPSSDTLAHKAAKDGDRLSRSERWRIAKGKLTNTDKPKRRPGKQPGDPGSSLARVAGPRLHRAALAGLLRVLRGEPRRRT
jgi:hypothetical protein